tara:strand:+ start:7552 stop:7950 length:399 start_codon:yes stop_codon:yes gene_type:complete
MAITGNGTTFSYAGGAVADVISISAPTVSTATIDTTNIASIHRTFIAGTIDSGEMSLEIMYDPNSDTDIEDAWDNTAVAAPVFKPCIIAFSDSATFTFDAILVGFSASVAIDDKVTASITLKITGAVTVAAS